MVSTRYLLAIDQGTTSTRAILFDREGRPRGTASREIRPSFPRPGWVEQDPEEIWSSTVETGRAAFRIAKVDPEEVAAIGITNQRETTLLWERASGKALHPAIVWQDRRTAEWCARQRADGIEALVRERTGLLLDPYFSASKLAWLLAEVPGARAAAARGELAFGTVDAFLLGRLTGGGTHATDATNASRTMLFDLRAQRWDEELLRRFDIPAAILPEVRDSAADFGATVSGVLGLSIPITGVAGDQQAALFGQACFRPGTLKSTYGTGAFLLLHTGERPVASANRLLATVAYRLKGEPSFALEGSVFSAGSAVQWLRDGLKIVADAADTERLAAAADPGKLVYLVPAFTGLGAPYWDADARGALLGLTRDAGAAEIARAALEAVGYQTRDLIEAMAADGAPRPAMLRVDGGMTANGWAMQFLADILERPVEVPAVRETTALGAAYLAGLHAGLFPSLQAIEGLWRRDRVFSPAMAWPEREARYAGWLDAVRRVRSGGQAPA
ncbi:MAG TPA: glycerol kinase GlpK [Planctomycetota bacterium]|jgi:glycerol kinase|nr:glycerol kinase GlpK [Planctomycetota bacterium]